MKKLLAAVLLILALVGGASPVLAVSDQGNTAITRIWVSDSPDQFACTASYIMPRINDAGSWIVSAGHCSIANLAKRNFQNTIAGAINWRAVLESHNSFLTSPDVDLAVGTVPDPREGQKEYLWLAEKTPNEGDVYIHGFPQGVERVSVAYVVPVEHADEYTALEEAPGEMGGMVIRKKLVDMYPGTRWLLSKHDDVQPGSSGSPILDGAGNIVGILWGHVGKESGLEGPGVKDGYDLVAFTPVERLLELMKLLGVKQPA